MVMMTCGGGSGFGSGSGAGPEPMDKQIWEFILSEITRDIMDQTHVMFGTIKVGIMELLDDCLGAFWAKNAT